MYKSIEKAHLLMLMFVSFLLTVVASPLQAENQVFSAPADIADISLAKQQNFEPDTPRRITIAEADVNTTVEYAPIISNTWKLYTDKAGFAEGSSYPNESLGNTIIFAHARPGLFANLQLARPGMIATLYSDRNIYVYRITNIKKISQWDTEKVKTLGENNLTLFTCDYDDNNFRVLVKARLISKIRREVI